MTRLWLAAACLLAPFTAAAAAPAEAAPTVHVAAAVTGCHPSISGNTASGYCTTVPAGGWYYLQATFRNKAGQTYPAYTARAYRPWTTLLLNAAPGYGVTSVQIIHS